MTYVFDLDETICQSDYPNNLDLMDKYYNSYPIKERIAIINNLYNQGHEIIIDTARGCKIGVTDELRDLTVKQLKDWGVKYHLLRIGIKYPGDFYIDDKAISDKDFFVNAV